MLMRAWQMVAVNERLQSVERQVETLPAGQVLVRVAGCGICHTDLGFLYDGVPIRHALPLVLGHEISGSIVGVGEGAEEWMDKDVIVPAVIPCGHCDLCRRGRGSICPKQIFPGNDIARRVRLATCVVPARRPLRGARSRGRWRRTPTGLELPDPLRHGRCRDDSHTRPS